MNRSLLQLNLTLLDDHKVLVKTLNYTGIHTIHELSMALEEYDNFDNFLGSAEELLNSLLIKQIGL